MKARIALITGLLLAQAIAHSQVSTDASDDPAAGKNRPLDTITVVGTRTERALGDVAATVSVIDAEDVERELARELPDPQEFDSDNVVAKLSWHPDDNHELTLGVDRYDNETDSRLLSDYGTVVFGTTIDRRDAHDERRRTRYSLRYDYDGELPLADSLELTLYRQTSETVQRTDEDRTTAANEPQTRERISWFDQDIDGAYLQFGKALDFGTTGQLFTYGLDYYKTDNAGLRDGGSFDAAGNPVFEFLPLPTRDFPLTEVEQLAFFLQDEITLLDGALRLSPGLRYDRFDADTTVDEIYLNGNPGTPPPEDYDDSEITVRFGIVYAFTDAWSAYAQYSEGFRAPPYSDVNLGFSHFIAGYKSIPNPELTSERSEGREFGLRMQGSAVSFSVGVFDTDYDDFIESRAIAPAFLPSGIDPADGLITFQSINRDDVEIKGAELSGSLELGAFLPSLEGFSIRTAIAYADGKDTSTSEPLNGIEPLTGVLGVNYTSRGGRWGGELVGTFIDGKDVDDIDPNNPRMPTAGYGILDLLAYTRISDKVSLNAGLFNLTDRTYIRWADTAAIGTSAPARFTQPGFNAGANVRVEF